jgi:hypothetical protein
LENESMSESEIIMTPEQPSAEPESNPAALPASSRAPDGLPEKFWDAKSNAVRLDSLIRSYGELERRLGGPREADLPASADGYQITLASDALSIDAETNQKLHEAGFTNRQAQLVYDLAHEKLAPLLEDAAGELDRQRQLDRLGAEFGGEDKWRLVSRQIAAWGDRNFPPDVFAALSSTADGVLAMHKLMASGEPALGGGNHSSEGGGNDADLRGLMRDPRYWRDRDPATVQKVRSGFRALYGSDA